MSAWVLANVLGRELKRATPNSPARVYRTPARFLLDARVRHSRAHTARLRALPRMNTSVPRHHPQSSSSLPQRWLAREATAISNVAPPAMRITKPKTPTTPPADCADEKEFIWDA